MRTGLQTLEEEKKAIKDITGDISSDDLEASRLDRKDIETIQSKFQNYFLYTR